MYSDEDNEELRWRLETGEKLPKAKVMMNEESRKEVEVSVRDAILVVAVQSVPFLVRNWNENDMRKKIFEYLSLAI